MESAADGTRPIATLKAWFAAGVAGWNRFWFTPSAPYTLAMLRVLGGSMLLYTHLVWLKDLDAFCGKNAWIDNATARALHTNQVGAWSHLWFIESPTLLYSQHFFGLAVYVALILGWQTRVVSVLACVITLSYCHRLIGAQFGLDQVNALLATYLAVGDSGGVWSVDRWLATHDQERPPPVEKSPWTTVAVRLIQWHMCVIYLFGGIGKLRGNTWQDGSAIWFAFANDEYQTLDMTWTWRYPWLLAALTHVTVFWETFYPFLVWHRWSRPIALAIAVAVHGGIAVALGMITFGVAMIIGNMAFLEPEWTRAVVHAVGRRLVPAAFNDELAESPEAKDASRAAHVVPTSKSGRAARRGGR